MVCICTGMQYWPYAKQMIESSKKYFLVNHQVDYFLWSDMQDSDYGATVFETAAAEWPFPTLMRYHLFLQQEEILKEYDYIFYCDVDMVFVGEVGNEILGDGLTMAKHPMYDLKKIYIPPYEPNKESSAYIHRLGRISVDENGKKWFEPLYAAGGFQGGRSEDFIKAMKVMKKSIGEDFNRNYNAIWNDESHWNRYLLDNPPVIVLSPSYVYPDSMIEEYYYKIWPEKYTPKLVTLTKSFSTSKEGGDAIRKTIGNL